ncbi:MAG: restriction endonuclease [Ignavibacteriales bacterium]|nr:restriction endonuclease [Ignavibacteriales bacterium]
MNNEKDKKGKSKQTAVKVIYAAMQILKEAGGELSGKEVIGRVEERVQLDDWEKGRYEKTGYIRWQSIMHFWTIDCMKAGYLRKKKGIWYLTYEGEKALKLGDAAFLNSATEKYREWKANQPIEVDDEQKDDEKYQKAKLDELEEEAIEGLRNYIISKNPYEFQDMVAALLRAMGYYTPFVAPKGKDGGIDIIAYQDPLGTKSPRIKVQVKHHPENAIAVKDVRSLLGLLNKDGEIGLFVTSGSFSGETERLARESHAHCKLIDFNELISLWQQYYSKLTDEEKNLLPLHPIYFLGSNE